MLGRRSTLIAIGWLFSSAASCYAGMPSPLPDKWPEFFSQHVPLTEMTSARLQSISFFLIGIAISTIFVRYLWNVMANDSNWLPRISLVKSFVMILLWGSLFIVVLTMFSGARELLTPGAWKKNGITYTLESKDEQ